MKKIFAHHGFGCYVGSVDLELADIDTEELAQILEFARDMDDPNMVLTAGEAEIAKLKTRLGSPTIEQLKSNLRMQPDEILIAALDAPDIFKLNNGEQIYADSRVYFIYNQKTEKFRPVVFDPYTDESESNRAMGQDVAKAKEEAVKLGMSKVRAYSMARQIQIAYAEKGIQVNIVPNEDENGGTYRLVGEVTDDAQIDAINTEWDETNR